MALLYGIVLGWSLYLGVAALLVALLMLVRWPARGRRMLACAGWGAVLVVAFVSLSALLMATLQPGSAWGGLAGRVPETAMSFGGVGVFLGALWGLIKSRP